MFAIAGAILFILAGIFVIASVLPHLVLIFALFGGACICLHLLGLLPWSYHRA